MLKQITHREAVDCYRGHLMIRGRWLADARRRFIRKLTTGEFNQHRVYHFPSPMVEAIAVRRQRGDFDEAALDSFITRAICNFLSKHQKET